MKCLFCGKEIDRKEYFCVKHWAALDATTRCRIERSKKPESLKKALEDNLEQLNIKYRHMNPDNQKLLYYAHPMEFYNTQRELDTLNSIIKQFPDYKIINPNQQEFYGTNMQFFCKLVCLCDLVVAEPFDDEKWSYGVATEIKTALNVGVEVKKIFQNDISDVNYLSYGSYLTKEETGERNQEIYKKNRI